MPSEGYGDDYAVWYFCHTLECTAPSLIAMSCLATDRARSGLSPDEGRELFVALEDQQAVSVALLRSSLVFAEIVLDNKHRLKVRYNSPPAWSLIASPAHSTYHDGDWIFIYLFVLFWTFACRGYILEHVAREEKKS